MKPLHVAAGAAAVLAATAIGVGLLVSGGDSPTSIALVPAVTFVPQVGAAPQQFTSPAAAGTSCAAPTLEPEESNFLTLINDYRAQNGLGALTLDLCLTAASDWDATDLGLNHYFGHNDPCNPATDCIHGHVCVGQNPGPCTADNPAVPQRDPFHRMTDFGYDFNTYKGENIAGGYTFASSVFQGWKDSPGHNANMLGSHYLVIGISRSNNDGDFGYYWTTDFGGVRTEGTPSPSPTRSPPPTPIPTITRTPALTTAPASPSPTRTPVSAPTATPTPTASPTAIPPTPTSSPSPCPGDYNNDRTVNGNDLLLFAPHFTFYGGTYDQSFDLHPDGKINGSDLLAMAPLLGPC